MSNDKRSRTANFESNQVPDHSLSKADPEVPTQPRDHLTRLDQGTGYPDRSQTLSTHIDRRETIHHHEADGYRPASLYPQHLPGLAESNIGIELTEQHAFPLDELAGPQCSHSNDGAVSHPHEESCNNDEIELPQAVVEGQDRFGSELLSGTKRKIDDNMPDDQMSFQEPPRVPSRAHSVSRPDSRRSNQGRTLRPFPNADRKSRVLSTNKHDAGSSKVLKLSVTQNSLSIANTKDKKHILASYKEFLHKGESYQEVFEQYEQQAAFIETQASKIVQMQGDVACSQQKIKALEAEKISLTQNMKKFADMSSKYKTHMNEVVKAQKYLTSQAAQIQKESSEILKARTIFDKIKKVVEDAKDLRVSAQQIHDVSTLNQELKRANERLSIENEKLGVDKTNLEEDNARLKTDLDTEKTTTELLKKDLDQKADDLLLETRNREQLEKQLECQATVHKELIDQLKQLPNAMSQELRKEDGVLAELLGSGNTTRSKLDEVASLIQQLKSVQPDASASLVKLFEDLFSRHENRSQNSEAGIAAFQKAIAETLTELKDTLGQLCLSKDAEAIYKDQISSLDKANEILKAEKATSEIEAQRSTQQHEELRRHLADCRSQLHSREEELEAARAVPVEDFGLTSKIQELNKAKEALETQLKNAEQALRNAQNEAKSKFEADAENVACIKDLEQKLAAAINRIDSFENEKARSLADQNLKHEREIQRLAQTAHEQRETTRLKSQSDLENTEQRLEQEKLKHAQTLQDLSQLQARFKAQAESTTDRENERVAYLQQTKHQMEQIQQFIEKAPSQKTPVLSSQELQSIKKTATDTRQMIVKALEDHSQTVLTAAEEQTRFEAKIRKTGALEIEKYDMAKENISLKEKITEMQRQRISHATVPQSFVSDTPTPNMLQEADDETLRSTMARKKLQKSNDLIITPSNNSNVEDSGSLRRAASLNASSSQTTKRGNFAGSNKIMVTPQIESKSVDAGLSRETDSQQRAASSQNSWRSIKPFSTFPNSSPSTEDDLVSLVDFPPEDNASHGNDVKCTSSKAPGQTISGVSLSVATVIRRSTGADTRGRSERKTSFASHVPSQPSPRDAMPAKSAMKKPKQNPNYATEASNIASIVGKEENINPPRQTLGMDNIRGFRSGATSTYILHQSSTQQLSGDVLEKGSYPAAPSRSGQKRPHDGLESSNASKRLVTTQRTKSSTRSKEIPDSQDKGKPY
ncbi:hypothetical protein ONS96_002210 [Cadophora gregata f. sp. sojae]|nr:hypothetical protein ONS96_002210 [Cadophora gregata f. sp. sojae]